MTAHPSSARSFRRSKLRKTAVALLLVLAGTSSALAGPKLHALLVIDTGASNAAALGIPIDGVRMLALLRDVGERSDLDVRVEVLANDDVTPDRIRGYYAALESGPDDALLFYYSGHGMTAGARPADLSEIPRRLPNGMISFGNKPYLNPLAHTFTLSGGDLLRMDVDAMMKRKTSRLNVVIGDCCAGFVEGEPRKAARAGSSKAELQRSSEGVKLGDLNLPGRTAVNVRTFEKLFVQSMGFVHIAATPVGVNARGDEDKGGHLTYSLAETLCADRAELERSLPEGEYDSHFTWSYFVGCVKAHHERTFPRPPNPEPGNNVAGVISKIGPIELGLNGSYNAFTPDTYYDEANCILFGIGETGGIPCRIMPGSPTGLTPGYAEIGAIGSTQLNIRNSRSQFDLLKRGDRGFTLDVFSNDITGPENFPRINRIQLR